MLTPRILVMPVFQRLTAFSQFLLVYFSYADIILGELIIILNGLLLRICENEFSFMFCISFYELSFLVYLNFVNQGFLGNFFSLWSSQNQGKGKVTSWCREVHNIPLRHKARKQAGSLFCLECYSVGLRGIGGEG